MSLGEHLICTFITALYVNKVVMCEWNIALKDEKVFLKRYQQMFVYCILHHDNDKNFNGLTERVLISEKRNGWLHITS